MSNSSSDDVILITAKYILRPISTVGILCNIINILVLTDKRFKESPYTYLIGLAFSDLVVSVLTFTHSIITDVTSKYRYYIVFWNVYIFYPCINIAIKSSVWITMALSIERVVFVSRPFQAKFFCRQNIARSVIISIMFCAIIENIPRVMRMNIQQNCRNNSSGFNWNRTAFGDSHNFTVYEWVDSVLSHFIPLAVLFCVNVYFILFLRKSSRQQQDLGLSNDRRRRSIHDQNRVILTLIEIICFFFIFIVPSAFAKENVARSLFVRHAQNETEFINSDTYRWVRAISNSLVTANSALNFFVYCLTNVKFFAALRVLHRRIRCRRGRAKCI